MSIGYAMICLRSRRLRLSSNNGHLDWKPDKIRVFQSFLYVCDVNMMLKIEPATFPTPKWMRLKSLSKCGNISLGLPGWQAVSPPRRDCDPPFTQKPERESGKGGLSHMDILGLIAVLSFGLTCFGIGYTFGKDSNKPQKQPPSRDKVSGYSC